MEELVLFSCFTLVLTFWFFKRKSFDTEFCQHDFYPTFVNPCSNITTTVQHELPDEDTIDLDRQDPGVKFRSSSSLTNIFLDPWRLHGISSGCLRFHIDPSSLPSVPINKDGRSGNVKTAWWMTSNNGYWTLFLVSSLFLINIPQSSLKVGLCSLGTLQDWVSPRGASIFRHREGVNLPSPAAAHGKDCEGFQDLKDS